MSQPFHAAGDRLEAIQTLLRAAAALLDEVAAVADPLRRRWEQVYERMPLADRGAILEVVEREVALRRIEGEAPGDNLTGFSIGPPNPNARLYARTIGAPPPYRTRDEVMRATLRASRMMALIPAGLKTDWDDAMLEAYGHLAPAERQAVAAHARNMLALLERADVARKAS